MSSEDGIMGLCPTYSNATFNGNSIVAYLKTAGIIDKNLFSFYL